VAAVVDRAVQAVVELVDDLLEEAKDDQVAAGGRGGRGSDRRGRPGV
jgi:hypothetical protein